MKTRTFGRIPNALCNSRDGIAEPLASCRNHVAGCIGDALDAFAEGVCRGAEGVALCGFVSALEQMHEGKAEEGDLVRSEEGEREGNLPRPLAAVPKKPLFPSQYQGF